jgi:hypothetical protein
MIEALEPVEVLKLPAMREDRRILRECICRRGKEHGLREVERFRVPG